MISHGGKLAHGPNWSYQQCSDGLKINLDEEMTKEQKHITVTCAEKTIKNVFNDIFINSGCVKFSSLI